MGVPSCISGFPKGEQLKTSFKMAAFVSLACLAVPSIAAAPEKPVELAPVDLAVVQSKTYAVPASTLFSATVATLQTLGYVDINASKDAGTIAGTTEAKAKTIYNIFWGLGKKKLTQKASLLVEGHGASGSMVRLNLHLNEMKSRGIFGTSFSDGKLVRFAGPYQEFYAALDAEVARRTPVTATSAAIPAQTAPTTSN
jgi:hypothetical protein